MGRPNDRGYMTVDVDGEQYKVHRICYALFHGVISPKMEIDHINRNRKDNSIENLRLVTSSENSRNTGMSPRNTSGVKGVHLYKRTGRWTTHMDGKQLGTFADRWDAICCRKSAELRR